MRKRLGRLVCVLAVTTACSESAAPPADTAAAPPAGTAATAPAAKAGAPAASATPAPAQPRFREITIPAGTTLSLALDTPVSSKESKVEDAVQAKLATAVLVNGAVALPAGTLATGSVLEAQQSGRVKGRATVSIGFDRLRSGAQTYPINAARITLQAEATKGEDAAKVGLGAAAGAIIGAIADGKKGAAVGGAVGAGAGTGVVLATRGDEIAVTPGTVIETTLERPLTIQVPVN